MLNINIGGSKKWTYIASDIRAKWQVLDVMPPTTDEAFYKLNLNSGEPFPFENASVDNYYCSHTLEHISPVRLPHIVSEIYRTLKSGGLIRVVVPCAKLAVRKYIEGDRQWLTKSGGPTAHRDHYPSTLLGLLMPWFYSTLIGGDGRTGHLMVFDLETLNYYFRRAGFRNINCKSYQKGSALFLGMDIKRHQVTSLYVEAQK